MIKSNSLLDTIEILNAQVHFLSKRKPYAADSQQELLNRVSFLEDTIRSDYQEIQSITRRLYLLRLLSTLLIVVTGLALYVK